MIIAKVKEVGQPWVWFQFYGRVYVLRPAFGPIATMVDTLEDEESATMSEIRRNLLEPRTAAFQPIILYDAGGP